MTERRGPGQCQAEDELESGPKPGRATPGVRLYTYCEKRVLQTKLVIAGFEQAWDLSRKPNPPPDEPHGTLFKHAGFSIKLGGTRGLQFAALSGLVWALQTHSPVFSTAAACFAAALDRVRRVKSEELHTFEVMRRLSFGHVYKIWVSEDELLAAMNPALDNDARKRLLANTRSRGLLEEGAGKWRAVW